MVELLPMVFPVRFVALFGWVFLRVFSTAFGGHKGMEMMWKGRVTRVLGMLWSRVTKTLRRDGSMLLATRAHARRMELGAAGKMPDSTDCGRRTWKTNPAKKDALSVARGCVGTTSFPTYRNHAAGSA